MLAPVAPEGYSGPVRAATLALFCLLTLGASGAAASGAAAPDAEQLRRWKGRYCTPLGCAAGTGSTARSLLGFGAAALAGAWVARRNAVTPSGS